MRRLTERVAYFATGPSARAVRVGDVPLRRPRRRARGTTRLLRAETGAELRVQLVALSLRGGGEQRAVVGAEDPRPEPRRTVSLSGGGRRVRSRRWVWARTQSVRGRRRTRTPRARRGSAAVAQAGGEHERVLERHRRALGHVRGGRVGGVADSTTCPCTQRSSATSSIGAAWTSPGAEARAPRGGSGEAGGEQPSRVAPGDGRGGVAVAVDPLAVERHGQERRTAPQHHRPGRDLRRAGREEAPAELADGPRCRRGPEGERRTALWIPSAPTTRS